MIGNRNVQRGEETVTMIHDAGGTASFKRTDVLVAAEIKALVDHAVKTYGGSIWLSTMPASKARCSSTLSIRLKPTSTR